MPLGLGKQKSLWAQVAFYTSLSLILPTGTVAGLVLGWYLDQWFHTAPALAILLGTMGAAGAIIEVLQILSRAEKNAGGNDSGSRSGPR